MEWLKYLVIEKYGGCVLINNWVQGTRYIKYSDGLLKSENNYINGIMDGIQRSWYENGQLHYEWNYEYGLQHGIQQWWYMNGPLMHKNNYINDIIQN